MSAITSSPIDPALQAEFQALWQLGLDGEIWATRLVKELISEPERAIWREKIDGAYERLGIDRDVIVLSFVQEGDQGRAQMAPNPRFTELKRDEVQRRRAPFKPLQAFFQFVVRHLKLPSVGSQAPEEAESAAASKDAAAGEGAP